MAWVGRRGVRPRTSIALTGVATFVGALVMGTTLLAWWHRTPEFSPYLLLAVPAIVVIARYPLALAADRGVIEVAFDSCVLVFLLMVAPPVVALGLWSIGTVLAQATIRRRWPIRAFNCGLTVSAGAVMALVVHAFSPLSPTSPRALLAITVACAAYVFTDVVLSAASIALEEHTSLRRSLVESQTLLGLGVFVGVDSLGYLGALTVRALPLWALALLAVPVSALLVAARAMSRARQHEARLSGLFTAARHTQSVRSRDDILEAVVGHAQSVLRTEEVFIRRAGPARPAEVGAVLMTDEAGPVWLIGAPRYDRQRYDQADQQAIEALAAVVTESLSRTRLLDELAGQARTDPLTGLANRSAFAARVKQSVESYRRHGRQLGVVYLDLDGFKAVNDRFGHHVGDALLVGAAERLMGCMRPSDLVARLGGDEFAVLVEDLAGERAAEEVCARILEVLRPDFRVGGICHTIRVSAGAALAEPAIDADGLLRNADMAMYQAKARGRDRYELYLPELRRANLGRLQMEEQLRLALDCDELRLCYQPVVDLGSGRIDGFEALLRWDHPQRGLVGPGQFVPLAEETGLIGPIGEWVLQRAVEDGARLARVAGRPLSMGVNVSGRQLHDGRLIDLVETLLDTDTSGQHLILELTESNLIGDDAESRRVLNTLRSLGVSLAIDDFGTGYSSIGYLQKLPIDVLKIDRSFLVSVVEDARSAALVEAILQMSAALDLTVVAEGIERPEQSRRLHSLGCALGQGFLFAPGLPVDAAAEFLVAEDTGSHPIPALSSAS